MQNKNTKFKPKQARRCCFWHKCKDFYLNKWAVVWIQRFLSGLNFINSEDGSCVIAKVIKVSEDYITLQTIHNEIIDIRFELIDCIAEHRDPGALEKELAQFILKKDFKLLPGGKETVIKDSA